MSDYFGKETFKLGFGLMRLPKLADGVSIDVEQVKEMVDLFIAAGGTYFDTAFVYDGGGSELAAGEALVKRYPRESYTLATKLNARVAENAEAARKQLEISLERTGAGYFDYYLLHAMNHDNMVKYEEYGIWDFVKEMKAKGLIKHYGFSFHDSPEVLNEILTAHPDVDFIQLQLNYADWENPKVQSRANYEMARSHGKSITVMEPVKGGALANPVDSVAKIFKAADPDASYASWAIRYIASLDGIITVLSGMSNVAQMKDNLSYMKEFKPMNEAELEVLRKAQEALASIPTIACTACHYCTEGCPMQIPIPEIFAARNKQLMFNQIEQGRKDYERAIEGVGSAADCIHCLQCEGACPQQLPITQYLEEIAQVMA